ncbi:MAG: four helix bundle protein [Bacteroidota bacterium]
MIIKTYQDLVVFQIAYKNAMNIFEISKLFPKEEKYAITDQIRRSSRSVCANISEAFRRRPYVKSFALRLNDAEAEASETQVWIKFSYNTIIAKIVVMINQAGKWKI